jgi:hypothetical protein
MPKNSIYSLITAALFLTIWGGCAKDKPAPVTPDTNPPRIVSTSPADGATQVPLDAVISVTFSEDMYNFSFSALTFYINGVQASLQYQSATKTASLTPNADLVVTKNYTAAVTTGVTDQAGNHLEEDYVWSFTTGAGSIMPLDIGNKWMFNLAVFDTISGDSVVSLDSTKIMRDTTILDEQWFIDNHGKIRTNRISGLWGVSGGGDRYLFLKFPASVDESYQADPDLGETITVQSINVLVGVPQGNHICYRYGGVVSDPTYKYRYYYKPNFGPVMIEKLTAGSSKIVERRSLISLILN